MPRHAYDFEPADYGGFDLDRVQPIVPQLYASMRRKILTMRLKPGEEVSEAGLAAAAGVSRTPARQVIKALVGEHLLEAFPSQGTYVSRIDASRLQQALTVRALLEPKIARECAELAEREELAAELAGILEEHQRSLERGDADAAYRCDSRFHEAICNDGADSFFWQIIRQARTEGDRLHALSTDRAGSLDRALRSHREIVEAIRKGDGDGAERAMREHMLQNRAIYDEAVALDSDVFVYREG